MGHHQPAKCEHPPGCERFEIVDTAGGADGGPDLRPLKGWGLAKSETTGKALLLCPDHLVDGADIIGSSACEACERGEPHSH